MTAARPRDLDAATLAHGLRAAVGSPEEWKLRMIEVVCAVDRGELESAREHLEASLQRISTPEKAPPNYAAEMAFYIAYLDGNACRAEQWLQGAEQQGAKQKLSLAKTFDYWLSVAAVREAEGLRQEADEAWRRAVDLAAEKPQAGLYMYERELLDKVRNRDWLCPQDVTPAVSVRLPEDDRSQLAV